MRSLTILPLAVLAIGVAACQQEPTVRLEQVRFNSGVDFGATPDEVLYRLGEPSAVGKSSTGYTVETLPAGPSLMDYDRWSYFTLPRRTLTITFADAAVSSVLCASDYDAGWACSFRGIKTGVAGGNQFKSTEDEVREEMGEPSSETIADGQKIMTYAKDGARFYLTRGSVDAIELSKPETAELPPDHS